MSNLWHDLLTLLQLLKRFACHFGFSFTTCCCILSARFVFSSRQSQSTTIRTRKFLTNRLLSRKQMVSTHVQNSVRVLGVQVQSVKRRPCSVPRVSRLASGLIRMEVCSPFCHSSSTGGLFDLTPVSHLCQTTSVATMHDRQTRAVKLSLI